MSNKEYIERASGIVRSKLEYMEGTNTESIELTYNELLNISTALVVATVLCRTN